MSRRRNRAGNKQADVSGVSKEHRELQKEENVSERDEYFQLYSTLIGAAVFSCTVTAVLWYVFLREKGLEFASVSSVRVVTQSSHDVQFILNVIKGEEPLVIKNSVVTTWEAYKHWKPSYLQSKISTISRVYENNNRWFGPYYDTNKPLSNFSNRVNSYKTDVELSAREFFTRIQHPTEGRYHYYTGDIDDLGHWALHDVSPIEELLAPNPQHSSINVWMGQPHVIAHSHYDGYHNFYSQLYGRKKFIMFRPTNWPGLYPYPFLHPSHAQAQVNLSEIGDVPIFPLLHKLESHEVILEPGDLLYMPPLWWHMVESLDVSISVNVWTDSKQSEVMERVFSLSLPFTEVDWHGANLRAIAGGMVMHAAVKAVCAKMGCVSPDEDKYIEEGVKPEQFHSAGEYLVYRLWSIRYKRLMAIGQQAAEFAGVTSSRKGILCEGGALPPLFFQGVSMKLKKETNLNKYVSELPKLIQHLPRDTWELWFGNYLEFMTASVVELKYVGLFLKHFGSCIKFY